jgi:hypothetical protein
MGIFQTAEYRAAEKKGGKNKEVSEPPRAPAPLSRRRPEHASIRGPRSENIKMNPDEHVITSSHGQLSSWDL